MKVNCSIQNDVQMVEVEGDLDFHSGLQFRKSGFDAVDGCLDSGSHPKRAHLPVLPDGKGIRFRVDLRDLVIPRLRSRDNCHRNQTGY